MLIKQIPVGPMANYSYIVGDEKTKVCGVVDPGWDPEKIMKTVEKEGLKITHILLTHSHFDHVRAVVEIVKRTGAKVYIHTLEAHNVKGIEPVKFDDGEKITIGNLEVLVIHTPGHSAGSSCFKVEDALFTGDTLFAGAIGRTDLPGGDPEEMFKSLRKIEQLSEKLIIYPGHDYGPNKVSTIGEQKKTNPYLQIKNIGDFLRF